MADWPQSARGQCPTCLSRRARGQRKCLASAWLAGHRGTAAMARCLLGVGLAESLPFPGPVVSVLRILHPLSFSLILVAWLHSIPGGLDKNVENETSLRVEAQRVSGCGCGEPAKRYGCIGVRRLSGSRGGRASVLCVQWLFITKRGHYKGVARKSKDTNNKNGLGLGWFSCVN